METSYINTLPQEVTDSVIDHLSDDRDSLKVCALVQRSWLPRARHHLHRNVALDCSQKKAPSANYYSTGAAKCVRSLKVITLPSPPAQGVRTDAKARAVWKVIPRFTELHDLTLVFSNWTGPARSWEWLRPAAQHVRRLNLVFATFMHSADFFEFVAMFPELERLSLTNISFGTATLTAIPVAPPHTWYIVPPEVTLAFALWLCRLPRPAIPQFNVQWEVHQPGCLVPVVDGLGPRLAQLALPLWSTRGVPSDVIKTALHSISFITAAPEIAKDGVEEALAFLTRIRVSELRSVVFDVRATAPLEAVSEQALEALDEALFGLPHSRFSSLEKVVFRVSHSAARSGLLERLKKGLSRAEKRGAVALEVVHDSV
ncbi:uncharacterized protein PHACADRAFT_253122 [Phanerochaete carnosa HHB-10118-sp]|uniref:F-box domain-containing protein n=1 Tax=Phanerochaete carnosa (strain HHB-10118-sp) TaxID=650164 RepID=K5V796_PHACS|nr:uncharacterized protein PHACADRAFT_253122 [Phanerochaete carnosa HHB-10118-sp]EKM58641.1 hypothetical protein PHACADRAFT_253122 [Phanerochaete carnosa HHB-10118-sp]